VYAEQARGGVYYGKTVYKFLSHIISAHAHRKARREACTLSKRVEDFAAENLLILGGFTGFYLLGKDEEKKNCYR
jgi:hypothetical protein